MEEKGEIRGRGRGKGENMIEGKLMAKSRW